MVAGRHRGISPAPCYTAYKYNSSDDVIKIGVVVHGVTATSFCRTTVSVAMLEVYYVADVQCIKVTC